MFAGRLKTSSGAVDRRRSAVVHRLHWQTEHRAESRRRRLDESRLLLPELSDGSGDFDVLSPLQPLLTLDQVVDPVDQQLDQLHLKVQPASFTFCSKTGRRSERVQDVTC